MACNGRPWTRTGTETPRLRYTAKGCANDPVTANPWTRSGTDTEPKAQKHTQRNKAHTSLSIWHRCSDISQIKSHRWRKTKPHNKGMAVGLKICAHATGLSQNGACIYMHAKLYMRMDYAYACVCACICVRMKCVHMCMCIRTYRYVCVNIYITTVHAWSYIYVCTTVQ